METYCTSGASASGCLASISASGIASATASSGFELAASNAEGGKDGLFFFGTGGRQANPWGNGNSYQCVVPPVKRGGLLTGADDREFILREELPTEGIDRSDICLSTP